MAHVHGIAGVGKTTLLAAFVGEAQERGALVMELDCRAIEPTERGLLLALADAAAAPEPTVAAIAARLASLARRVVLVLDTYEVFRLMDAWVRRRLLPALPDHARVILAGRQPPVAAWLAAPAWHGLFRGVSLGPLHDRDARRLLEQAGIAAGATARIQAFARGHPLALRLAARALLEDPSADLERMTLPHVLEKLARAHLEDVADPAMRRTLEACCVMRRVRHSLLEAIAPAAAGDGAYERLQRLPFVEPSPEGLWIHDAVREAVAASLRMADPARHRSARQSAWRQLREELAGAGPRELWTCTADMLYLLENPVVREAFFPSEAQALHVEPAGDEDGAAIEEILAHHDGEEAARHLSGWRERHPAAFHVVRESHGAAAGFYCMFEPSAVADSALERDPLTRAWCRHLRAEPVSASERVLFIRRWLGRDHGEAPSPVQAACWLDIKRSYLELRPALRRVYLGVRDLDPYAQAAARLRFQVLPRLEVTMDGERYRTAVLDFGPASVDGWLAELVSDELQILHEDIVDLASRELVVDGVRTPLTGLEFGLLSYLLQHEGRAVSREELLRRVWGYESGSASNVVDQVVRSLRSKLGARGVRIEPIRGVGYRLRKD